MGEIYRAEDAQLERTVAIKLLAAAFANDDSVRERFTREALAAASSRAPSTVTIFDVGEYEGRPYIVMEYFLGGSLADRLAAEGAQPLGRTLEWLRETAAALDAAHAHGIVHRDVKPANLLLDDEGGVHVADFGVASAAHLGAMTETGTVVGTAGYLSPEQARGERATAASDRYALAVVAFELLTGTRPFARDSATAEALAHVSAPIPPASQLRSRPAARGGRRPRPRSRQGAGGPLLSRGPRRRPARRARRRGRADANSTRPRAGAGRAAAQLDSCRCWLSSSSGPASSRRRSSRAATTRPRRRRRHRRRSGRRSCRRSRRRRRPPSRRPRNPRPLNPRPLNPRPRRRRPASASELNDEGFALMQAGDYESALPLLEQAVQLSSGSGELVEAYASYNLAFTRLSLGSCDGVLDLLRRSEEVQGKRGEIKRLQRQAEKSCGGGTTRTSSRADPRLCFS